ncbi:MAG: alpha/beta fold hydrolase [Chloroflexota bacterium]
MMRKIVGSVLILLLLIYVGVGFFFSGVILFGGEHDLPKPVELAIADDAPQWDVDGWEKVDIEVTDEISLAGNYFDNPADGQCAVVLLHGHTSNRNELIDYAPIYWGYGCDVLAYDARGHGESDPAALTFGYHEREDAAKVVDWVSQHAGIEPGQIGLVGTSYGAATSLQTLAVRDDLAFVVADSAYQDMETIILARGAADYGAYVSIFNPIIKLITNMRGDMVFDEVAPQDTVIGKQTPILLLHSERDGFTGAFHSENIFANANPATTELHITPWTDRHGAAFHENPPGYTAIVTGFLEEKAPDFGDSPN